ncbi:: AHH [Tuwongella immobilis]|uniref:: AHH n=1 Tax=Tuwongella immobilis TaxID=692036 RepID=A0A6C2YJV5_9BACT|nr:: AHH [Tuwongella immobilis]VTR99050.1 : AHH [Tuwongella immobilis]
MKSAARGGFNINGVENGIFLDSRVVHPQGARHPNYNARVGRELNELQKLNLNDIQAAAALNRLANQLGGELRLRTIRLD